MSEPSQEFVDRFLANLSFQLVAMTDDIKDIRDGEFPIGERRGTVRGLDAAVGAAQGLLNGDPELTMVLCVPPQNAYCGTVRVYRHGGGGMRPNAPDFVPPDNPTEGRTIIP